MTEREVVLKIEDGMDRHQVMATTYQQRNFYRQFRDGFFDTNTSFNYLLHHWVARWCQQRRGRVLDVCCGRGLLLPLLRLPSDRAQRVTSYTGVDIEPKNVEWLTKRVTDGKEVDPVGYYPFETRFVEGNVAEVDQLLEGEQFDSIVYTASIEHMNPDDGRASLGALRHLVAPGCQMVVTSPNKPSGEDGYDTRYKAHVYEWGYDELKEALRAAGWEVRDSWGCDIRSADLEEACERTDFGSELRRLRQLVPREWLLPVLAPLFPEVAGEVAILCAADEQPTLFGGA